MVYFSKTNDFQTLRIASTRINNSQSESNKNNRNDTVLHGVTLAMIIDYLVEEYGFEKLGEMIRINCFMSNPSKQSSLKFLRKTEWARLQVQGLYVRTVLETGRHAIKSKEVLHEKLGK